LKRRFRFDRTAPRSTAFCARIHVNSVSGNRVMPTVRIRNASEYSEEVQKLFEVSKEWFKHDFHEPPAMSRLMAWDVKFGGPHGRAMRKAMQPGEFSRAEKEMVAAAVSGVNACDY